MSTCTPSSPRASDFGTSYQSPLPCQRPLRASSGVWHGFTEPCTELFSKILTSTVFTITYLRLTTTLYTVQVWQCSRYGPVLYRKKKKSYIKHKIFFSRGGIFCKITVFDWYIQWSIKFSDLSLNSKLQISMTPRLERWTGKKPIIYYAII